MDDLGCTFLWWNELPLHLVVVFPQAGVFIKLALRAEDYSFATAFASYTVAEAQIFKPARDEFDEIINLKLLPVLTKNAKFLQFRSLPLTVKDVEQQLRAIEFVSGRNAIDNEQLVKTVNEVTNLELVVAEPDENEFDMFGNAVKPDPVATAVDTAVGIAEGTAPFNKPDGGNGTPKKSPSRKSEMSGITALAEEAAAYVRSGKKGAKFVKLMQSVGSLSKAELKVFKTLIAQEVYGTVTMSDPNGSPDLAYDALLSMADREHLSGEL